MWLLIDQMINILFLTENQRSKHTCRHIFNQIKVSSGQVVFCLYSNCLMRCEYKLCTYVCSYRKMIITFISGIFEISKFIWFTSHVFVFVSCSCLLIFLLIQWFCIIVLAFQTAQLNLIQRTRKEVRKNPELSLMMRYKILLLSRQRQKILTEELMDLLTDGWIE